MFPHMKKLRVLDIRVIGKRGFKIKNRKQLEYIKSVYPKLEILNGLDLCKVKFKQNRNIKNTNKSMLGSSRCVSRRKNSCRSVLRGVNSKKQRNKSVINGYQSINNHSNINSRVKLKSMK